MCFKLALSKYQKSYKTQDDLSWALKKAVDSKNEFHC